MTAGSPKYQCLHGTQDATDDRNRRQEKGLTAKRPPRNSAQLAPRRPETCTKTRQTRMLLPFARGKDSQCAGKMVIRLRRIRRREPGRAMTCLIHPGGSECHRPVKESATDPGCDGRHRHLAAMRDTCLPATHLMRGARRRPDAPLPVNSSSPDWTGIASGQPP